MRRDLTGIALHTDSLKKVSRHMRHILDRRGERSHCYNSFIDGIKEWDSMFRRGRFDSFTKTVDVILCRRVWR